MSRAQFGALVSAIVPEERQAVADQCWTRTGRLLDPAGASAPVMLQLVAALLPAVPGDDVWRDLVVVTGRAGMVRWGLRNDTGGSRSIVVSLLVDGAEVGTNAAPGAGVGVLWGGDMSGSRWLPSTSLGGPMFGVDLWRQPFSTGLTIRVRHSGAGTILAWAEVMMASDTAITAGRPVSG